MEKEFTYFPPIKYLIQILIGVLAGFMFLYISIYKGDGDWVNLLMLFFSLLFFGYAFLFYRTCFQNKHGFSIKINNSRITLPFIDNGSKISFNFSDLNEIEVFETYETQIIELTTNKGSLQIEKNWMKKKQYTDFLNLLKERIK